MTAYKPWGGLGHREAWRTHANRHPPVEPALSFQASKLKELRPFSYRT